MSRARRAAHMLLILNIDHHSTPHVLQACIETPDTWNRCGACTRASAANCWWNYIIIVTQGDMYKGDARASNILTRIFVFCKELSFPTAADLDQL